ncbi:MAG: hypothetical protein LBL44_06510 [Treponema sp.]|nr:hypothetical protein [Treponema sp.]
MAKEDKKEKDFENHIREIIKNKIICSKNDFMLLDSKDITDIIICRNINIPKIFFIEVKHYSDKKGRIGFGYGDGSGFQPEILRKRPKYFEDSFIWIFQKENDDKYYVLNNDDCLNYISGGSIGEVGGKQNNFQLKLFDDIKPMNENDFLKWLENWLLK